MFRTKSRRLGASIFFSPISYFLRESSSSLRRSSASLIRGSVESDRIRKSLLRKLKNRLNHFMRPLYHKSLSQEIIWICGEREAVAEEWIYESPTDAETLIVTSLPVWEMFTIVQRLVASRFMSSLLTEYVEGSLEVASARRATCSARSVSR